MTDSRSRRAPGGALFGALALAAALLADWLFFRESVGVSLPLFLTALLGIVLYRRPAARRRIGSLVFIGCGLLALTLDRSVIAATLVIGTLVHLATAPYSSGSPAAMLERALLAALLLPLRPLKDVVLVTEGRRRHGMRAGGGSGLHVWALPTGLTLVFIVLFWGANPVIAGWMRGAGDLAWNLGDLIEAVRVVLWIGVTFGVWALLRLRVRPQSRIHNLVERERHWMDASTTVRSLVLFNVVFLVHNVLDARYLWLGGVLPDGLTYAEYAHRGAYLLIITVILAGGFVIAAFPGDAAPRSRALVWLVGLWIGQNAWLTVSAARRLALYVDAYGLTMLRVAAGLWLLVVALGLLSMVGRVAARWSNLRLLSVNGVATAVVLLGSCLVDLRGGVAWYNVHRALRPDPPAAPLDIAYLVDLGPSSVPALAHLESSSGWTGVRREATAALATMRGTLDERLADWRGWTWRDARRRALIASAGR